MFKRLQQLLKVPVLYVEDCIGEKVQAAVNTAPNGSVLLLENVRFYAEEEANDPEFARKLAAPAQLYVNDAFGTAHRAHASTEGVTKYLKPAVAGFLLQKELDYLVRRLRVAEDVHALTSHGFPGHPRTAPSPSPCAPSPQSWAAPRSPPRSASSRRCSQSATPWCWVVAWCAPALLRLYAAPDSASPDLHLLQGAGQEDGRQPG